MAEKKDKQSTGDEIQSAVEAAAGPATVADPKNPLFEMFDAPHFTPIESATIYKNRDGSRVVGLAAVLLPLKAINVTVPGVVSMRKLPNKKSEPSIEFKFKGGAFKPLDDAANGQIVAYRKWVAEQYARKQNGAPLAIGRSAAAVSMGSPVDFPADDDEDDD